MKTININGKEYTKEEFLKKIYTVPSISGLFENLNNFPRHEPEPPTLRPMSELAKAAGKVNLLTGLNGTAGHEEWKIGHLHSIKKCLIGEQVFYLSRKTGVFADGYGKKILGWLPLPNPNEIKP